MSAPQPVDPQALASDPDRSVFVTANAGSGKTKVLVDRIARLLLRGGAPSSFVCITFTKAAAAEMQRRLFERLGRWSVMADAPLAAELDRLDPDDPGRERADRLARARALFARALETPGGLRIQTFHAFCERVLRRFPLEAGLSPGFKVIETAETVRRRREALHAAMGAPDGAAAFARLAGRMGLAEIEALAQARSPLAANPSVFARTRHGVRRTLEEAQHVLLDHAPWADLLEAAEILPRYGVKCSDLATRIGAARAQADVDGYVGIFLKDDGEPRRDAPTRKARAENPFVDRLFGDAGEMGRVLEIVQELKAIACAQETEALLVLAQGARGAYLADLNAAQRLDFDGLIARAQVLLTDATSAAWVLYKLDGAIDHVLIDEGQDTSPEQWAIVRPIEEEFFAGEGARHRPRTVFAVGDPKQSIYAFQGADPEGFLAESQHLAALAHNAGRAFAAPSLDTSFRSSPEILALVDGVFADAALIAGEPGRSEIVRHRAWRSGEGGVVEWWPFAPRPERAPSEPWDAPLDQEQGGSAIAQLSAATARWCAGLIEEGAAVWDRGARRAAHAGDILILVQRRGPIFTQTIRALKRAGLPVAGADRMTLKDELAVEDLLALARAALDPGDDLSLACALKSPFIGLTDDDRDLFPLAFARGRGVRLIDRLMAQDHPRYAHARAAIATARARAGDHPHTFFASILEGAGPDGASGWARLFARLGEEARDPVEELLSRALSAGASGASTLQAFVHAIEKDEEPVKREMEAAGGAVRVMTVHGAKGLEAPIVIVPDTAAAPGLRSGAAFTSSGPVLFGPRRRDDEALRAIRAGEEEKAHAEYLRLLYVALTRARDRLLVCAHASGRGEGAPGAESWHARVGRALEHAEPIETPFGEGRRLGSPALAPLAPTKAGAWRAPSWARTPLARDPDKPVRPARAPAFSFAADAATRFVRGRLIHGLLQRLPDVAPAARRAAGRAWLTPQGVADIEALALVEEALGVILNPAFAAAFAPGSRAEAPLAGRDAEGRLVRGVVDRLAVGSSEVLVLDFKTDRPAARAVEDTPAAYLRQMRRYRDLLRQIYTGRAVRTGLIWTEAPRLQELSDAALDAHDVGLG